MAHDFKQVRTEQGQKMLAPARDGALRLPEVVEAVDGFGHISFRVRNKPFVIMGENADGPWLSVKSDVHTQAFLLKQGTFTNHAGRGWHHREWRIFDQIALDRPVEYPHEDPLQSG